MSVKARQHISQYFVFVYFVDNFMNLINKNELESIQDCLNNHLRAAISRALEM